MRQRSEVSDGKSAETSDAPGDSAVGAAAAPAHVPPRAGSPGRPRLADRYVIRRLLKQGNGISTFLAIDEVDGEQVVLKTFEPGALNSSRQARFVHETRVLRELSGAGVCALRDAGQSDGQLYLAQRYVPGQTLEEALGHGPLTVIGTLRTGLAVAVALDIAHGAGIHHRDVKTGNVIVEGRQPDGSFAEVTLIDFGFARSPWLDESIRDDLVGTVRYLSPEAAGLLPTGPDERSDLYALGVVLYECLAGRPPFDGDSVGDLLRQHLSTPVPDLRVAVPDVPRALAAIVHRLLRKDPAERYQTAGAVVSDLEHVLDAIEAGDHDPSIVIGRSDRRGTLTDPAFVGREAELAALRAFAGGLRRSGGGLLLLDADSGGGKTRLLNELTNSATALGVHVLSGQGIQHGGQRPFTLLHGVADGLVELFAGDPVGQIDLANGLEDVAPAIVRALPALAPVLGAAAESDTGPEEFGELRSLAALRRLLATAATPDRPLLVILDDCQWADVLTLRLLAELFADGDQHPAHLGVIAAFRSEEVGPNHPLRGIAAARTLHLGPLSSRSVALLVESMAGAVPPAAIDTVIRLADGNPFMAAAVLRGLAESEAIVPGEDGWTVDPSRLSDAQTARRSAAFLVRRLELLSPQSLELLSVGAVLGKSFDVGIAARIAAQQAEAAAILDDARRRRLIWVSEDGAFATFFHDKIRESLLARLSGEQRSALHGEAADALLAQGSNDDNQELVFDLAYHLDAAGRPADALPFALAAAELARSRYALDVAVTYYRMAAAAAVDRDGPTRQRIAEGLGDVLTLQGVYAEAETHLTLARSLVNDPQQAAALDGKLGGLAFKQADIAKAKARLEGALALLGRPVPAPWARPFFLLWEVLVQAAHTLIPATTGRRDPKRSSGEFLAMRLYSRLAYLYWFHSGKVSCAWAHLREMNLAERYPPSAELGQAWSEHAPALTMVPWYSRGVRYAQRSLAVRRELGDVWGQGQSLNFTGVVLYAASRYTEAKEACERAQRLLLRTGDQWEVNTGNWTLAFCHLRVGDLTGAYEVARRTYESAIAIGDKAAAGIALDTWARATSGRMPRELIQAQLAHGSDDAQTTAELHLAEALVLRARGDLAAALECLDRSIEVIRQAGLRQEYIAPVFAWHATVLREFAESTPSHAPRERSRRLRAAAKAARIARRWARFYRNNAAHALREAGLVASLRGRPRRAVRLLGASCEIAARHGEKYEEALSRLARLTVRMAPEEEIAAARAAVAAFDPVCAEQAEEAAEPSSLSIFDRFTTLLHVGRSIASATSAIALQNAVRESAVALLRPERCHLIPVAALSDDTLTTQSGEDVAGISRTLLKAAVDVGKPVIAIDEPAGTTDSLVLSGVRSALAAPIFVHGEPHSCLYVTHRHVGELFGEDERQLAALITTLAGAGYEHLAGSEARFRSLAQRSSDVTTLVDAAGFVTYQSAAMQTVFALPAGTFIGHPLTDWVHPDDVEHVEAVLTRAKHDGSVTRLECRLRAADGRYRFTESAVTNLLDEPTVGALVVNTRDITDRKLAADQLRVVEERERIARDLHDVVIQRLFAVGLGLDALSNRLEGSDAEQVVHATNELHHTIRDIRGAIFSLRSDEPSRPLAERLDKVFDRGAHMLGFDPDVRIEGPLEDVPDELHLHLLATLNEALSNVARHAHAARVEVVIRLTADELVAVVADDGVGLPPQRQESGLANLRRRAEIVGGSMSVGTGLDGRGLRLCWEVPLS